MSNKVEDVSNVSATVELNDTALLKESSRGTPETSKIQALADKIYARTHGAKGSIDPYKGKEALGFFEMAFRYASMKEKFFFGITVVCIFLYGCTRPLFSLMFG